MKIILSTITFFLFTSIAHTQAPPQAKKILFLGDSLTEGYGVSKESSYPLLVEKMLNKEIQRVRVINAGSSGSTSASALSRLKWHVKSKPDIVVLALGANDGLRGVKVDNTRANLIKAIEFAREHKIEVVMAGMKLPYNYGKDYRQKFEKIFTELAKKYKTGLIPFLLKGVGGVKELNLADGIHPNEKGHLLIAKTVSDYLRKYL